jgi:hypothetical protein
MHQKTQENKAMCTLPGIWTEIGPRLFKKEYNAGAVWIEAELNELIVNLIAKAHGDMGDIINAVITINGLHVKADDKSAIEYGISLLEKSISDFLQEKDNQADSPILNWLVAYGVGGCWSGYTDATIIQASTKEEAMSKASDICRRETAEERGSHRGASYDAELIETDVKDTALWCSRLKPSAKALLNFELKNK